MLLLAPVYDDLIIHLDRTLQSQGHTKDLAEPEITLKVLSIWSMVGPGAEQLAKAFKDFVGKTGPGPQRRA